MNDSNKSTLEKITPKLIGPNLYESITPHQHLPRLYGGELLAQAIWVGHQTIEKKFSLHSMQSVFIQPGDSGIHSTFKVNPLKIGKSFLVKQVDVSQQNGTIFTALLSFHIPEEGFEHQNQIPKIPAPETLESDESIFQKEAPPEIKKNNYLGKWPIEFRQVDPAGFFQPEKKAPHSAIWFKMRETLPDSPVVHKTMLAYAIDTPILATALRPHGASYWKGNVQAASLNHSMWFHRPFKADEWLLCSMQSPSANSGLGIVYGNILSRDGQLVATVIQEGLLRPINGRMSLTK